MPYKIPVKLSNKQTILPIEKEDEVIGQVFFEKTDQYDIRIHNTELNKTYYIESNPLKFKGRFIIKDDNYKPVCKVSMGYKIIHSLLERGEYYFVKSAFFQVKYKCYLNREVKTTLNITRIDKRRYYEITSKDDDFINVIGLFLLARAVRLKALIN